MPLIRIDVIERVCLNIKKGMRMNILSLFYFLIILSVFSLEVQSETMGELITNKVKKFKKVILAL